MQEENYGIDTKFSNASLYKRFVIPAIIIQLFTGILELGDRIIGALFIGEKILAVVTLMFPVLLFGIAISVMIMIGLGIEINFLLGRKEKEKAQSISTFVLIFASIVSIILAALLLIFNGNIIQLIVQNNELKELASKYLYYIALTFPPLAIGYTLSTVIIADDSPKYNMVGRILLSLGNVILNVIFVVIFKMGINGLGLATLTSSTLFFLYNISYFVFGFNKTFKIVKPIIDFKELGKMLYNGLSEFVTIFSNGFSMLALNYVISRFIGLEFFIAYSTFHMFALLYIKVRYGGIDGISPIISKTLGEKRILKGIDLTKYSFIITGLISIAIYVLIYFVIQPVSEIFVTNINTIIDIKKIYLTYGIVLLFGITIDFVGGFLTAVKKPVQSLVLNGIKALILNPVILSIFIITVGKNGLWLGAISIELIYIPMLYFVVRKIVRNIRKECNRDD